jgi:hypothetical protein
MASLDKPNPWKKVIMKADENARPLLTYQEYLKKHNESRNKFSTQNKEIPRGWTKN